MVSTGPVMVFTLALLLALPCALTAYDWPDNVTQHKGFIEVDKKNEVFYFYWFFESRSAPSTDPLVVWLTGGPGCSSELALFGENGPFLINGSNPEPFYNKYGWNSFANLLYVDQPAGTGFSYGKKALDYDTGEGEVAKDMWNFLLAFYAMYPQYAKLDLYVTGESYAGHYVPAIGQAIVQSNSIYAKNLKGIAIGNGWVDPYIQYKAYAQYMYKQGFINSTIRDVADGMYDVCKGLIDSKVWPVAFYECQLIELLVLTTSELKLGRTINPYDVRIPCKVPPLCYDMSGITKFLARSDVRADLGVGTHSWEQCNRVVEIFLLSDWIKEFKDAVSTVLGQGRRVLVYSGKEDFICNYLGGQEWVNATKWDGMKQFDAAPYKDWHVDGKVAGEVKSYDKLTFLQVEGAGHMVPKDQPESALDMLKRFLNNQPFDN